MVDLIYGSISLSLQNKVDAIEGASINHSLAEELYADASLGTPQLAGSQEAKILGVRWNPQSYCLIFSVSDIARAAQIVEPTKRNVVSVVGRFYDPIGFLAPVVLRFKLLFQRLCVNKMDWDQPLANSLLDKWNALVHDLQTEIQISIPRCYFHDAEGDLISTTLCGFCDASTKAYAAVVYLRVETVCGIRVQFIVSKTRVAPTQELTIPRLELLSALLLARLITVVSDDLKLILPQFDLKCYTDSTVALYWIRGTEKDWKPFVNNRVTEIRNHVPPECWSHCPGLSNPADLPSHGLTLLELSLSQMWHQGPPWLLAQDMDQEPDEFTMPMECASEMKTPKEKTHNLLITTQAPTIESVVKCEDFSTLTRLLRVTGKCVISLLDYLSYQADLDDEDFTVGQEQVRKRVKYSNLVLNHFWKRWRQEYLAELRESHRNYNQRCSGAPMISVGDVVVVRDDSLPRSFWKLGLIEELFKGLDGVARGALVRLAPKDGKQSLLCRPIQRLYPLEISQAARERDSTGKETTEPSQETDVAVSESNSDTIRSRPKREAARKSEEKRRAWIKERLVFLKIIMLIHSVDHVWSTGGGCWNLNLLVYDLCIIAYDYVILIAYTYFYDHAFAL
jgi:hypothetical protein